jgi:cytochrome c-type biogenesis protein CcmH
MTKKTIWIALVIGLSMALIPLTQTSAQQPTPPTDDEVNAVARQLYCPVCENVSLDVCPTQACAQWRELIREKLSQGWTADEIKDYFAQQYGDQVLPTPPKRGINLLVYILPVLAIGGGAVWLYFNMKKMRKTHAILENKTPTAAERPADSDEYAARIEAELRRRKE